MRIVKDYLKDVTDQPLFTADLQIRVPNRKSAITITLFKSGRTTHLRSRFRRQLLLVLKPFWQTIDEEIECFAIVRHRSNEL